MRLALVLLCAGLLACRAAVPVTAAAPESGAARAKTSLQLIAEARDRGELDDDLATLYRVYSVRDDGKLPPLYRGTEPLKDGTTVLRDARARFPALRPETQEALRPYLYPSVER